MSLRPRVLPTGFVAPCLPTNAPQPPSGELWLHEIKHDGFRVIARRRASGFGTALVAYAEQNDLAYEYEYTPAFAKWQRLLTPEQYEIVGARTSRGVSRVMLFSKAIIQAEWEANAPLREALAIKRERLRALRAKRAAKQRSSSS